MPNGDEGKNVTRLLVAVRKFRNMYGEWPTRARIPSVCLQNIRDDGLDSNEFNHLSSQLELVDDDSAFIVESSETRFFNYSSGEFGNVEGNRGDARQEDVSPEAVERWLFGPAGWQSINKSRSSLEKFLEDDENEHRHQGNPRVRCNAIYKTGDNVNAQLTPSQAMSLAQHLLQKAQLILDHDLEDAAVHLWNQGAENETFYCGLTKARKGPRRSKS